MGPSMDRTRVDERMDDPGLAAAEHDRALAGLARLNAVARSHRLVGSAIEREAHAVGRELHVMDVACGGADGPVRLGRVLASRGARVRWTFVDASAHALRVARTRASRAGLAFDCVQADAVAGTLPGTADVVCCSLFIHHLERAAAVSALRAMREAALRAVAVADLARTRPGLAVAWAAAHLLSRSPVVHFDAPASVRAAYTRAEAADLAREAGLRGAVLRDAWPARWVLEWRRR